ncbi:MAG TPA: hypothetical protein VJ326_06530 [Thermoplasmata archaeon]|nr:hypothetical protein [Thermoplasmata archaeon]
MVKVRNPLASLALTILGAFGGSIVLSIPMLFLGYVGLDYFELELFILAFAAFGSGLLAGRASLLGSMGLVGCLLGGFVGFLLFQMFLWQTGTGLDFLLSLALGGLCGLGGFSTGKLAVRRVERAIQDLPKLRKCQRCGTRVGLTARRCWSCKAFLPPT